MQKLLFCAIFLLLCGGCARIHEMNDEVERSTALIQENAEAVENSTGAVQANVKAVESSTNLIEKNTAALQELMLILPNMPIKMGVLFLLACLVLPSLLLVIAIVRFEKRLGTLIKKI